jgi:hypothetical protein
LGPFTEGLFERCLEKDMLAGFSPPTGEIVTKLMTEITTKTGLTLKTFESNSAMDSYMEDRNYG